MNPKDSSENEKRDEENEDMEEFRRDIGENFEQGFGKLLDDSPPAEIEQVLKEHPRDSN